MTDKLEAFRDIVSFEDVSLINERDEVVQDFYEGCQGDSLVINKWFGIQASADTTRVLDEVGLIMPHNTPYLLTNYYAMTSLWLSRLFFERGLSSGDTMGAMVTVAAPL